MKLLIKDIASEAFMPSLEKILTLDLDVLDAFHLSASLNILQDKKATFMKLRQTYFTKWGHVVKSENGEDLTAIKDEHLDEFFKAMELLNNIEFEIPLDKKIKLPIKDNKGEPLKYTALQLYPILALVDL